jgi:hypothetical protein
MGVLRTVTFVFRIAQPLACADRLTFHKVRFGTEFGSVIKYIRRKGLLKCDGLRGLVRNSGQTLPTLPYSS